MANSRYLKCEICKKEVSAHSKVSPHYNLRGKVLCRECFNKLSKEEAVECAKCGINVPYLEIKSNLCSDCWEKRLEELRKFYGRYHQRLKESLEQKGIIVADKSTEHLDKYGRPLKPVITDGGNCLPLRDDTKGFYGGDECAIFTVEARDAVFAIPDNGIGLRYLEAAFDKWFMDDAYSIASSTFLALASDGKDIYTLDDQGMVRSTKSDFKQYNLFNILNELRRIASVHFTIKDIDEAVKAFRDGSKTDVTSDVYYDYKQKVFIEKRYTGSSHDGVMEEYAVISKDALLKRITRYISIREIFDKRSIPMTVIVEQLEERRDLSGAVLPKPVQVY